jgi:hypothetical protein
MSLHRVLIRTAQQQFKLAVGVRAYCAEQNGKQAFNYLHSFSFGPHLADHEELALKEWQEQFAAAALEHSACYIMAIQVDKAFEELYPNRFEHENQTLVHSARIAKLLRNAFAHDCLNPKWIIPKVCKNTKYQVEKIIYLDTALLHDESLNRMHYGGPLALLRFSQYVIDNFVPKTTAKN